MIKDQRVSVQLCRLMNCHRLCECLVFDFYQFFESFWEGSTHPSHIPRICRLLPAQCWWMTVEWGERMTDRWNASVWLDGRNVCVWFTARGHTWENNKSIWDTGGQFRGGKTQARCCGNSVPACYAEFNGWTASNISWNLSLPMS